MSANRQYRTWPYDLFKGIVALILLSLLLLLPLRGRSLLQTQLGTLTVLDVPQVTSNAGPVTLTGRGVPGTTLELLAGATSLGTTLVGVDGTWALPTTLPPGAYDLRALVVGAGNSILAESATVAWNPAAVATTTAALSLAPPVLAGNAAQFSGTAAPGATVEVVAGETALGSTVAGADGAWSLTAELPPGDYQLQARVLDATGAVTDSSEALAFNVPAPIAAIVPTIDPVTFDGESAAISGTGAPGSTVELADGETVLGSTVVAPDGTWRLDTVLDPGDYNLEVRSLDASGAIVNRSSAVAVNVPDPRASLVPTLAEPQVDGDSVTMAGTGAPGATVQIVSGEEILGTATVAEDGTWSLTPDLPPGDYALQVRTLDDAETVLNESAVLAWTAPAAPVAAAPTLTTPALVNGTATFSGTAIAGTPVELLSGETILGSTDAGADGTWTLESELEPGDYQLQARSTGADGTSVVTSPSLAWSVRADGSVLSLTEPQADLDGRLTFGGTATPGTTLQILVDDEVIGTTSAGADGLWEVDYDAPETANFTLAARDVAAVDLQSVPLTVDVPALIVAAANRQAASLGQPGVRAGEAITITAPITPDTLATGAEAITSTLAATATASAIAAVAPVTATAAVTAAVPATGTGSAPAPSATTRVTATATAIATATATATQTAPANLGTATAVTPTEQDALTTPTPAPATDIVTPTVAAEQAVATATPAAGESEVEAETPASSAGAGQAYVVQSDDWLSKLAQEFLGDATLFPLIIEATNAKAAEDPSFEPINDQNLIEVGQKIWIPAQP